MSQHTVADFLRPPGFERPERSALLREASAVTEVGRYARRAVTERVVRRSTPYAGRAPYRSADPVLLVPGFLAGDQSLALLARSLRGEGFRTYRSHMHVNIGCTMAAAGMLERRLEQVAHRRGTRVRVVGHSLGGMIARGVAARRPDLVSGIVTLGSPVLAPGAHHGSLAAGVDVLVRLSRAGVPGLMAEDCVAGECARQSFEQARTPLADDIGFTAVYSRRDGFVDWRACLDPDAETREVRSSHFGMAFDPDCVDLVVDALRSPVLRQTSAVEVDRGEIA
ncbi:MAG: esterase/lipase family protein [Nocardioides sp.]|uniref:esterase/lipase family protein n=1 Tax=Nocardioides sp. TaxID=35761 RepID=UPI003F0FDF2A